MSSIRLLLLGVLLRRQPIHGYEVRRELEMWHADCWANIAYGSIYSALGKMAEEGLVEAANGDGSERPSARTEYTIADSGRAEFKRLLHEYWWEIKPTIDPFQIALTFMDQLPRPELLRALRQRAGQLQDSILTLQYTLTTSQTRDTRQRHLDEGVRLMIAHLEADLHWMQEVIQKVECGELP